MRACTFQPQCSAAVSVRGRAAEPVGSSLSGVRAGEAVVAVDVRSIEPRFERGVDVTPVHDGGRSCRRVARASEPDECR